MNGDEPPLKPAERHGPDLPALPLDLPPGLSSDHIDLVQRAARECREALENPQTNYPIEQQMPADLLISICNAYETGYGAWEADHLDQIIFARTALKEATDAIRAEHLRNAGDPDAMPSAYESAKTIIAELNNLYAEVDTAIRNIDPDQVEKAQTLIDSRRDVTAPRTEAEAEIRDVTTQAEVLEGEIVETDEPIQSVGTQINILSNNTLNLSFGDLWIKIQKLKISAAVVNIAFKAQNLFSGSIKLAGEKLEEALTALAEAAKKFGDMASGIAGLSGTIDTILKPLARAAENGDRLVQSVKKAWTRLFGAKQELPWPTGLRLHPPEGSPDDPRDVELVEVRRFEAGDNGIFGLAPLPGGNFVSGGVDAKLRLWSLDQPEPLTLLEGHERKINRIAALGEMHVVTASDDRTVILWNIETQSVVRRYTSLKEGVRDVAALDRDWFASAAKSDVRIWHRDGDDSTLEAAFEHACGVAALSPDLLVTGEFRANDLSVLNAKDGSTVWQTSLERSELWKATAVTSETFVTVSRASTRLCLWSVNQRESPRELGEADDIAQDVAALSTTRAVSAHDDGIYLWSLPHGGLLAKFKTANLLRGIRALPREPGGPSRFVCGGDNGYLALWEVRSKP